MWIVCSVDGNDKRKRNGKRSSPKTRNGGTVGNGAYHSKINIQDQQIYIQIKKKWFDSGVIVDYAMPSDHFVTRHRLFHAM